MAVVKSKYAFVQGYLSPNLDKVTHDSSLR
jgi:hypothetical protein